MIPETPEWNITAVQRHYEYLHLSPGQAEQIYLFEQESRDYMTGALVFSFWEEKEYELDRFRTILSPEQLALYERDRQVSIESHEASLRKSDAAEWAAEIALNEEMIGWYKESFIPAMRRDALRSGVHLFMEREKIDYLRSEYKRFLLKTRRDTLVNHYRQSRGWQPNVLRLALLRQELLRLWPEYVLFLTWADAPTKTMAGFVLERYQGLCQQAAEFFREKAAEAKEQWLSVRTKHTGEPVIRGWHTTIYEERWSGAELGLMALWLMDPGGAAGYKPNTAFNFT